MKIKTLVVSSSLIAALTLPFAVFANSCDGSEISIANNTDAIMLVKAVPTSQGTITPSGSQYNMVAPSGTYEYRIGSNGNGAKGQLDINFRKGIIKINDLGSAKYDFEFAPKEEGIININTICQPTLNQVSNTLDSSLKISSSVQKGTPAKINLQAT